MITFTNNFNILGLISNIFVFGDAGAGSTSNQGTFAASILSFNMPNADILTINIPDVINPTEAIPNAKLILS